MEASILGEGQPLFTLGVGEVNPRWTSTCTLAQSPEMLGRFVDGRKIPSVHFLERGDFRRSLSFVFRLPKRAHCITGYADRLAGNDQFNTSILLLPRCAGI